MIAYRWEIPRCVCRRDAAFRLQVVGQDARAAWNLAAEMRGARRNARVVGGFGHPERIGMIELAPEDRRLGKTRCFHTNFTTNSALCDGQYLQYQIRFTVWASRPAWSSPFTTDRLYLDSEKISAMNAPSPAMHDLARRLLAASRSAPSDASAKAGVHVHEAVVMFETLRITLSKSTGANGFASLLNRALVLARAGVPALKSVQVGTNCHIEGLEELAATDGGANAAVALAAHLLTLLVTFIGEPLTVRLLHEGWPDANLFT